VSHIVVIGAGLAGLPVAIELRSRLAGKHRITLIASSPHLEFTPVNPWVAVGWRQCAPARSALQRPLEALGVHWLAEAVAGIDASAARLHLRSGTMLSYDYLVIATEPVSAQQAIPGMDLLGSAPGVCTHQQASHAWSEYQRFLTNPGPLVIAAVGLPRCTGPAYEFAVVLDADLRGRGMRDRAPITFITCEPSIGHMGLEGTENARRFMANQLRQRQITWLSDTQISSVETERLQAIDCAVHDATHRRRVLPFRYAMIVPSGEALHAVRHVSGLCDPQGRVLVDRTPRSRRYSNIFALGGAGPVVLQGADNDGAGERHTCIEPLLSAIRAELVGEERDGRSANLVPVLPVNYEAC
jgi:sulfide:quinone oxidoreductase